MPSPEPLRTMLTAAACLLVGGAAGWWMHGDSATPIIAVNAPPVSEKVAVRADAHATAAAREASTNEASRGDAVNFATAIRATFADRDPLSRGIRLRQIIRDLDPAALPAAVAAAARLSDEEQAEICQLLGARWIKSDPDAATKWIQSTDQLPADLKTKLLAPR